MESEIAYQEETIENQSIQNAEPVPSFLKNSSKGQGIEKEQEMSPEDVENDSGKANKCPNRPSTSSVQINIHQETDLKGWTLSLDKLPHFNEGYLDDKLIHESQTMPDKLKPNAHRNKMHGYKLWKEGFVSKVRVKPNISHSGFVLLLVKSFVSASMKSTKYTVYCHLNQNTGKVVHAKCNCKAGQGGCCKHVAALLYTILDYSNLNLKYVPEDVTCTQVLQKWSVPSRKLSSNVAIRFDELEFEKANFQKDRQNGRKRPLVKGRRDGFCATPDFAKISAENIRSMADAFAATGKAKIFVQTLKGNNYKPCHFFDTEGNNIDQPEMQESSRIRPDVFGEMSSEIDFALLGSCLDDTALKVGVSVARARIVEEETRSQSKSSLWHFERSKRLTSSLFGRIINRRKKIFPKSIIETITKTGTGKKLVTASLKWGTDNESVAIKKYQEEHAMIVIESGLIINPKWPWLAASPDGLVIADNKCSGAVEVKCPYSKLDMEISEACKDKSFFMEMKPTGPSLKPTHAYFYQCQGIMNIAEIPWIDFIVYTTKDMTVQRIQRDRILWKNKMLPELTSFFLEYILCIQ